MKVYFATWLAEKSQGVALSKKRERKRLLSYYLLREQKADDKQLRKYLRSGIVSLRKKK